MTLGLAVPASPALPPSSASRLSRRPREGGVPLARGNAQGRRCEALGVRSMAPCSLPSGNILPAPWKAIRSEVLSGGQFCPTGDRHQCLELLVVTWSGGGRVYHWHLVDRGRGTTKHPTMHRQPPNRGSSGPNVRGAEDGRTRPAPSPVCRALEAEPVFWGVRGCRAVISLLSCSLPGLVNNTGIDWFMPWPSQALHAVAKSFLGE